MTSANCCRVASGQLPSGSFSLGDAAVVVLASLALAMATGTMQSELAWFRRVGGAIGTLVAAGFLLVIALVNLAILCGVWQDFRHVARGGTLDCAAPQAMSAGGGLLAWVTQPVFSALSPEPATCIHLASCSDWGSIRP
jgi:nickel/cobalt transporter (NiCoT) family protein